MWMRVGLILLTAFLLAPSMSAQTKAIRLGKLWDGEGRVLTNPVVLVEGDRIVSVGTSLSVISSDAEIIDLSAYTGLPGLIDVHTHMTQGQKPNSGYSPVVNMVLGQEALRKTLEVDVTTVRDLDASEYMDIAMRDLINMGKMVGPRMFVVGCGLRSHFAAGSAMPGCGLIDGPTEFMRAARKQLAAGAGWVKVFGSTGGGDDVTGFQTVTFDEMKAAADVTHALGKRIAIHSYGPAAARDAVIAGADSLEHATDMDDETMAEMVRRNVFYGPTIDHNRYYIENGEELGFGSGYEDRLNAFIERNLETARLAFEAGVRFAMGSDAIYSMFGQNTRELGWFVKAGMSPEQALRTATHDAAELLGMENVLEAVKEGYLADIPAVEGDPLIDISVLFTNVRWVMKAGTVVVDKRTPGLTN